MFKHKIWVFIVIFIMLNSQINLLTQWNLGVLAHSKLNSNERIYIEKLDNTLGTPIFDEEFLEETQILNNPALTQYNPAQQFMDSILPSVNIGSSNFSNDSNLRTGGIQKAQHKIETLEFNPATNIQEQFFNQQQSLFSRSFPQNFSKNLSQSASLNASQNFMTKSGKVSEIKIDTPLAPFHMLPKVDDVEMLQSESTFGLPKTEDTAKGIEILTAPVNHSIIYQGHWEDISLEYNLRPKNSEAYNGYFGYEILVLNRIKLSSGSNPSYPEDFLLLQEGEWLPSIPFQYQFYHDYFPYAIVVMVAYQVYTKTSSENTSSEISTVDYTSTISIISYVDTQIPEVIEKPQKSIAFTSDDLHRICSIKNSEFIEIPDNILENLVNQSPLNAPGENMLSDFEEKECSPTLDEFKFSDLLFIEQGESDPIFAFNLTASFPDSFRFFLQVDGYSDLISLESGNWQSGKALQFQIPANIQENNINNSTFTAFFSDFFGNTIALSSRITRVEQSSPAILDFPSSEREIAKFEQANQTHPNELFILQQQNEYFLNSQLVRTIIEAPNSQLKVKIFDSAKIIDQSISWTFFDAFPGNYSLYKDGAIIPGYSNLTYESLVPVIYFLGPELVPGKDNLFNITASDQLGNTIDDYVIVYVIDTVKPTISGDNSLLFQETTLNERITWIPQDHHPAYYNISKDGVLIPEHINKPWSSNTVITLTLGSLSQGLHSFTLNVSDVTGNYEGFTTLVVSNETQSFVSNFPNTTIELNSTGNVISWFVIGSQPDNYEITKEGFVLKSGQWASGDKISIFVDQLSVGKHNYTIRIFDQDNNVVERSTQINVVDTTPPEILFITDPLQLQVGSTGNIEVSISDPSPSTYCFYQNEILLKCENWNTRFDFSYPITNLELGSYSYRFQAFDVHSNYVQAIFPITVLDTVAPAFMNTQQDIISVQYTTHLIHLDFTWQVADNQPNNYTIYLQAGSDIPLQSGQWNSSSPIRFSQSFQSKGIFSYKILVNDTSGNFATDYFILNVEDTVSPSITGYKDPEYQFNSSGNKIYWELTELEPTTYFIQHNSSFFDAGTYTNNERLEFNIDGLSYGVHAFQITAYDVSGNFAQTEILVMNLADPLIVETPNDLTYEFSSTGNRVVWRAQNLLPTVYSIYLNNGFLTESTWYFNETILYSVDGLPVGVSELKIEFYSEPGTFSFDTVLITVIDTTVPTISSIPQVNVEHGSTGNTITWQFSDSHPNNYTITRNAELLETGFWISPHPLVLAIDGLTFGVYEFRVTVHDSNGNFATTATLVIVGDTVSPVLFSKPQGFSYVQGFGGSTLSWNASDLNPDGYIIRRNNVSISQNTWTTENLINLVLDASLDIGDYRYQITIYDSYGNQIIDIVDVKVIEAEYPRFSSLQADFTYEYGSTGNAISWTVVDSDPNTFLLRDNNQILIGNAPWLSDFPINFTIDGNQLGDHLYRLVISDGDGNIIRDNATVTVVDTIAPGLSIHLPVSYESETVQNSLTWIATDDLPGQYTLTRNDIPLHSGTWTNTQQTFSFPIDGYPTGIYEFQIQVSDTSGNVASNKVIVTVFDQTAPRITQMSAVSFEYGTTENTISFTVVDLNPSYYEVHLNSRYIETNHWVSGLLYFRSVDFLPVGNHLYQFEFFDTSGNSKVLDIQVSVFDTIDPIFNTLPSDRIFEFSHNKEFVSWNVSDLNPSLYTIVKDNVFFISGIWNSETDIHSAPIFLNDRLGTAVYTINVFDTSGNSAQDSISITIQDTIRPVIVSQSIFQNGDGTIIENPTQSNPTIEFGTEATVSWIIFDNFGEGNYSITLNTTSSISNVTWISNEPFNFSLTNFSIGSHILELTVLDGFSNEITTNFTLSVHDTTNPSLTTLSVKTISSETSTENLTWRANDLNPDYYVILRDNSFYSSQNWNSTQNITVNLSNLPAGVYVYEIIVFDSLGNSSLDRVVVNVFDTTPPKITHYLVNLQTSLSSHQAGTKGSALKWVANDDSPGRFLILQNNYPLIEGTWRSGENITIPLDTLELGVHQFTIEFFDALNNFSNDTISITIIDTQKPIIMGSSTFTYQLSPDNYTVTWKICEPNPQNYTVLFQNTPVFSGYYTQNQEISISRTPNELGLYHFEIQVQDKFGYLNSHSVTVTITELIAPVIVQELANLTVEFGVNINNELIWKAIDNNPGEYRLYLKEMLHQTGSWLSDRNETLRFSGLAVGTYKLRLYVFDIANQTTVSESFLTVRDSTAPYMFQLNSFSFESVSQTGNLTTYGFDLNPDTFRLLYNGKLLQNESWSTNSQINLQIPTNFKIGTYQFLLLLYDQFNNIAITEFSVHIVDTLSPQILANFSQPIELGEPNFIVWQTFDSHPQGYEIRLNDEIVFTESIENQNEIVNSLLPPTSSGTYLYSVTVFDSSWNTQTIDIQIVVQDRSAPVFTEIPENSTTIDYKSTTEIISITMYDAQPGTYTVTRNGTTIRQLTTWQNNVSITIPISTPIIGVYIYTITSFDILGFAKSLIHEVSVVDRESPMISEVSSQFMVEYSNATVLTLIVSESFPESFIITQQPITFDQNGQVFSSEKFANNLFARVKTGTLTLTEAKNEIMTMLPIIHQGAWSIEQVFNLTFSTLEVGYYSTLAVFFDSSGNLAYKEIVITVQDTVNPQFIQIPGSEVEIDSLNGSLNWIVYDLAPGTYQIFLNNILFINETWVKQETIIQAPILNLQLKTDYRFTVQLKDRNGNLVVSDSIIKLLDTIPPRLSQYFQQEIVEQNGTNNTILWTVKEQRGTNFTLYINGVKSKTGTIQNQTLELEIANTEIATYNYTIVVEDAESNRISATAIITVIDTVAPVITAPDTITVSKNFGHNYTWSATDANPSRYVILNQNAEIETGFWNSSKAVLLPLDNLIPGIHTITIMVYDEFGNSEKATITVIVENSPTQQLFENPWFYVGVFGILLTISTISYIYIRIRKRERA